MSCATITVKQGDSVALAYKTKPTQDMTNWTCTVVVKTELSDVSPILSDTLTDESTDLTQKIGQISTSLVPVGRHWIIAQLDNAFTSESKEVHSVLIVEEQGLP